ncbi:MAG: hypothetical protein GY862_34165 [Gammaproteobacteria bacterium]|nr:hypothetical protein [Gammaproteobacteria bacterium]
MRTPGYQENWFPCGAWEPERPVHGSGSFRAARLVPMRRMGTREAGTRERKFRAARLVPMRRMGTRKAGTRERKFPCRPTGSHAAHGNQKTASLKRDKGLKPEARFFRVFRVFRCFRKTPDCPA